MADWFLRSGRAITGPYTLEELRFLRSRGRLRAGEHLWRDGDSEWRPADMVLKDAAPQAAKPAVNNRRESMAVTEDDPPMPAVDDDEPAPADDEGDPAPDDEHPKPPPLPMSRRRKATAVAVAVGVLIVILILLLFYFLGRRAGTSLGENGTGTAGASGPGSVSSSGNEKPGGAAAAAASSKNEGSASAPPPQESKGPSPRSAAKAPSSAPAPAKRPGGVGDPAGTARRAARRPSGFSIQPLETDAASDDGDSEPPDDGTPGNRVEFFGTRAKAESVVFIVDMSGSMSSGRRFPRAVEELLRSLQELRPPQTFLILFYNFTTHSVMDPEPVRLLPATDANRRLAADWARSLSPGGGTMPDDALEQALALGPELVFFLSDGEIPPTALATARSHNRGKKTVIHTVCFESPMGSRILRDLAHENGGRYRFVR